MTQAVPGMVHFNRYGMGLRYIPVDFMLSADNKPFETAGFFRSAAAVTVHFNVSLHLIIVIDCSRLFYLWATPLFRLGFQRPLKLEDLWSLRCVRALS